MSDDRERHLNIITVNVKAGNNKKKDALPFVRLNAAVKMFIVEKNCESVSYLYSYISISRYIYRYIFIYIYIYG